MAMIYIYRTSIIVVRVLHNSHVSLPWMVFTCVRSVPGMYNVLDDG